MIERLRTPGVLFRCQSCGADDFAQLRAFVVQDINAFDRQKFSGDDEFEPAFGFDEFLQGNRDLVNEIGAAFADATFVVVWRGGGPAADKLIGDVPAEASVGQSVHDFSNTSRELPKAIGEFNWIHWPEFSIKNHRSSIINHR
jgi:hypothetical protein